MALGVIANNNLTNHYLIYQVLWKARQCTIQYLCLSDKIKRWCQDAMFCKKITAHWREKEHWLKAEHKKFKKCEIWDGSRFSEYAWFRDPTALWHLPALCPFCKHVVSSKYMNEVSKQNMNANGTVSIECPNCYNCFDHLLKSTRGDPRNIALIGHWVAAIFYIFKTQLW